jgi:MFS family permease
MKLAFIVTGLCLAVFLTGMVCKCFPFLPPRLIRLQDQTILATAAPTISNDFHSLDDIAWWTNIYLLTLSTFQLFYGKLYSLFSVKLIYIGAIVIFEIGSLVCTTAPNSVALILGRAIAGFGASGIFSGGVLIVTKTMSLTRRPAYLGIMSGVFGVAAIAGPFIGGALTERNWRWCFGINLPIGACTIFLCILLVQTPQEPTVTSLSKWQKLDQFDLPGTILMIVSLVCLLLGLQWGGSLYPWANGRLIALFVLSGVLLATFAASQYWNIFSKANTIPPTISKSRDIWLAASYATGLNGGIYIAMIYLPLWFQIVRSKTSLSSGVLLTPTIGAYVVGSVIAGGATTATTYYNPAMILGTVLLVAGAAVLTTLDPTTPTSKLIGYGLLYGFGAGFGFGQPIYIVQTLLPECDVAVGVTFITLVQNLSAAIFVAVAQSVFQNGLVHKIAEIAPEMNTSGLLQSGAGDLLSVIPQQNQLEARKAVSDSMVQTFYIILALSCTTAIGALGVRWQSMKASRASDDANSGALEGIP